MNHNIKAYQPVSARKNRPYCQFVDMAKDLYRARELIWRLFFRDFKARYKQSFIGWGWIFLLPLVAVGTFIILNQSGAIKIENTPVPYIIYGFLSISLWQIFAGGLSATTGSVIAAGSFITKVNFPKEALVISSIGSAIVNFLARLVLLLIIYIAHGLTPSLWLLLSPILIFPLILFTLGLGFVTSLFNTVIRDVQTIINTVLAFLLFLMPIMYTTPKDSVIHQINRMNPLFILINIPRKIIISGSLTQLREFILSAIFAVAVFLFGWFIFTKAQSKIAEAA